MAMTSTTRAWARGGTVFAATVLLLAGIFQLFQGIAAIIKNQFFIIGPNYAYVVNVRTWGWIHLAIGIVAIVAGLSLYTGMLWARIVGVAIAAISAIANFFWLPYYPLWSLLIIAFDIFAIWAISMAGRDVMLGREAGAATGAYRGEMMQPEERWPATNPPATAGRHYAGEPAKEGTRDQAAAERQQQAEAMAQRGQTGPGGQPGPSQPGTSGQTGQGTPRDPNYPSS
jgi:hypothetical protein